MHGAGLGFTARMLGIALLWAIRTDRILVEIPARGRLPSRSLEPAATPRWCDRAPFTLQCLYKPWTHCAIPDSVRKAATIPSIGTMCPARLCRNTSFGYRIRSTRYEAPVVHVRLSWIHNTHFLWVGAHSKAWGAALRFLFRPRDWVRRLGECVMQANGLRPRSFITLHMRDSTQKRAELERMNERVPTVDTYHAIARIVSRRLGLEAVFVQTASAAALANFSMLAKRMKVSHTDNPRGDSDAWGGADPSRVMHEAVVGAVNAHIGSQAAILLSPSASVWTMFTAALITNRTDCSPLNLGVACEDVSMAVCPKELAYGGDGGRCEKPLVVAVAHESGVLPRVRRVRSG